MRSENTVTRKLYMYIFGILFITVLDVSQDLTLSKRSRRHVYVLYLRDARGCSAKPPRCEFDRAALAAPLSEPPQR